MNLDFLNNEKYLNIMGWYFLIMGWILVLGFNLPDVAMPLFILALFAFGRGTYLGAKRLWGK